MDAIERDKSAPRRAQQAQLQLLGTPRAGNIRPRLRLHAQGSRGTREPVSGELRPSPPRSVWDRTLSKGFEHVVHARPMMSLSNTYSIMEVDEWFERVSKALDGEEFSIVGELKFDGTSISITYRDGRMVRAVTRGDGTQGTMSRPT